MCYRNINQLGHINRSFVICTTIVCTPLIRLLTCPIYIIKLIFNFLLTDGGSLIGILNMPHSNNSLPISLSWIPFWILVELWMLTFEESVNKMSKIMSRELSGCLKNTSVYTIYSLYLLHTNHKSHTRSTGDYGEYTRYKVNNIPVIYDRGHDRGHEGEVYHNELR